MKKCLLLEKVTKDESRHSHRLLLRPARRHQHCGWALAPSPAASILPAQRPCRSSGRPLPYPQESLARCCSPTVSTLLSPLIGVAAFPKSSRSPLVFSKSLLCPLLICWLWAMLVWLRWVLGFFMFAKNLFPRTQEGPVSGPTREGGVGGLPDHRIATKRAQDRPV